MAKKGKYVYDWPRPMVSVDAVVFGFFRDKVKLLLIRRGREPFKGQWALPGGYLEIDEELEDAVARELAEEAGLVDVPLEQMHTFGKCGRDPRGRQITIAFTGTVTKGQGRIRAGDDAKEARWFDIKELPEDLAFDHNEVAEFAIRRLKRKKVYRLKTEGQKKKAVTKR
ncbi:MAG: NUDIX domain-containing protein [Planctomycetota bacterium]|jgi:8-oxo-dGTP diphosphatase